MLDKKGIPIIISVACISIIIYSIIPFLLNRFSFLNHIVISHYIGQLRHTILLLPIVTFLYFIVPLRNLLDYASYITRLKEPHFLLSLWLLSLCATSFISYKYYDHIPQTDDVAAYNQAKIFLTGKRWAPSPPYPEFFDDGMVNNQGRRFSMTAPGHSIILLIGFLIHATWLICPLMGSGLLIILYFLLKDLFSPLTARTGAIFMMLSPIFLFFSASHLSQNSSTFFSLLTLFLIVKLIKTHNSLFSLFGGLSLGVAFLSRPALPLAFFLSIIIFLFLTITKHKGNLHSGTTILFIIGFIPLLILQLYDNLILTGNVLHYGYSLAEIPTLNAVGFGIGIGEPTFNIPGHTPLKALINLLYNCFVLSQHLFGWPLLSLIFVFLWRPRLHFDKLILGIIGCAVIFMSLYWFHGASPIGTHYYHEIVPLLVIITASKIDSMNHNIRPLITLLFLISVFAYLPQATKVFELWGSNNRCYNEVRKHNIHNAIIFIRDIVTDDDRIGIINMHNYNSVSFRNTVNIEDGDIIYAKDLGNKKNYKLKILYPHRKTYIFEYLEDGKKWHIIDYQL
ncbi:MAG: glycosyltransferase family 39 protein [bacterium]|nr:glycosyltransferase family 39 protein [bacterium]